MGNTNGGIEDLADAAGNWLVVGLGNPGEEYDLTRHNVGFRVVDILASRFGVRIRRNECRSLVGRAELEGRAFELVKPQTYMNLSGEAVACLLKKPSRSPQRVLVVVDDLALPFGTIRMRKKGSAGGHNGLRSIIGALGNQEFGRLRIGIDPGHPISNTKKFVLDRFSASDSEKLAEVLERSADAAESVMKDGFESAMSVFNG